MIDRETRFSETGNFVLKIMDGVVNIGLFVGTDRDSAVLKIEGKIRRSGGEESPHREGKQDHDELR